MRAYTMRNQGAPSRSWRRLDRKISLAKICSPSPLSMHAMYTCRRGADAEGGAPVGGSSGVGVGVVDADELGAGVAATSLLSSFCSGVACFASSSSLRQPTSTPPVLSSTESRPVGEED